MTTSRVSLSAGPPADARTAGLSTDGEQVMAELAAGQHVNNEVDGRVEDDHEISDSRVVVVPAAALAMSLIEERPDDTINERRSLTDYEDEDNDYQRDGEILLLLLLVVARQRCRDSSHLLPLSALLFQGRDQLGVEKCQQDHGTAEHRQEVHDVVVEDAKDMISSDSGEVVNPNDEALLTVERQTVHVAVFEEPRDVVEDRSDRQVADMASTAW